MYSAEKGYKKITKLLLDAGANKNAKTSFLLGQKAEYFAKEAGYSEIAELIKNYDKNDFASQEPTGNRYETSDYEPS
jgi:ankyrin repeat protein